MMDKKKGEKKGHGVHDNTSKGISKTFSLVKSNN